MTPIGSASPASCLRAFDAAARELRSDYADHGRGGVGEAILALHAFADTLTAAVAGMEAEADRLPLAGEKRFESLRATRLLLESVFDELLDPPAWRLLAAAVDLATEGS